MCIRDRYTEVEEKKVSKKPIVGVVNGLAVYGANLGIDVYKRQK